MKAQFCGFRFRLLKPDDVRRVPLQHQGTPEEVLERISVCGSSAMLAFEGEAHVGQLQFRPYVPDTRSPKGLHDPLYWMDFQGHAPSLPERTLALFCYHVGQLDDTDARDPRYFGRGIGIKLLDETLAWAQSVGFEAVVAKGLSSLRPVIEYMGGMPTAVYTSRNFLQAAAYRDTELRSCLDEVLHGRYGIALQEALQTLVAAGVNLDEAAMVTVCLRKFA